MQSLHIGALIVSGVFVILTLIWSVALVGGHLIHFNKPDHQRYIVRILFMPPIYALDSWFSLLLRHNSWAIFIDIVRDCYEAYVIYSFFKLLVCFLGGKEAVNTLSSSKPNEWKYPQGNLFYKRCLQGVLQYVFIRPAMAVLAAFLQAGGVYGDGEFHGNRGYLYILIINNISVCIALYYLALFYNRFQLELEPHSPILKFLVIKGVVFFTFWQSVAIVVANWLGLIPSRPPDYTTATVSFLINDFLVCVEMFFAAIAHTYAFPYTLYSTSMIDSDGLFIPSQHRRVSIFRHKVRKVQHAMPGALNALGQVSSQRDVVDDTIDSVAAERAFAYSKFANSDDGEANFEGADQPKQWPFHREDSFSIIRKNTPARASAISLTEAEARAMTAPVAEAIARGSNPAGAAVLTTNPFSSKDDGMNDLML